jgi:hypothetical protein
MPVRYIGYRTSGPRKLSIVELRPCSMIQFEKVHSTTSSTRLGAVSDLQKEYPRPVLCTFGRKF